MGHEKLAPYPLFGIIEHGNGASRPLINHDVGLGIAGGSDYRGILVRPLGSEKIERSYLHGCNRIGNDPPGITSNWLRQRFVYDCNRSPYVRFGFWDIRREQHAYLVPVRA